MAKYTEPDERQVKESISWFKKNIGILDDSGKVKQKFVRRPKSGILLSFTYKPKFASKLDYYDTFPLVLVIDKKDKGFLGLNIHYLPPRYRSLLLYRLRSIQAKSSYDEYDKIKISYNVVKRYASLKSAIPCIRHYKLKNVKSKVLQVPWSDWYLAASLPTARFKNAPKSRIWSESINKI